MLKKPVVISVLAIAIVGVLIALRLSPSKENSSATKPAGASALPVKGYVLNPRKLDNKVIASGTITANEEVELRSEASGRITRILFSEGSTVKQGNLLVKINDNELQAQLQRTEYRRKLAEVREERQRKLLEQKAVSQEEYDNALNELNTLRAEIEITRAQIEKTEVRAPFDGQIGLRYVSVGAFITPTTKIATIESIRPVKIDFSVPEKYAGVVRKGDKVLFRVQSEEKKREGVVYAIEPKVDPATRTLPVRAIYPNTEGTVFPGAFAEVELQLQEIDRAFMIPTEALVPELKGQSVFVARNGKAASKKVEVGIRTDKDVQITSGLNEGDTVITTGILQLRPGMSVNFTDVASD
ncbi:MAG: hypothetical protein HY22_01410 [[Candidatus Thermochlorobacteriaceae] bacterium GBChlB]|nr:MAG: hypothetical protein HY22_01410 [[Candidatus Thermochlorobacteriaceae] bacterium GBChlB]